MIEDFCSFFFRCEQYQISNVVLSGSKILTLKILNFELNRFRKNMLKKKRNVLNVEYVEYSKGDRERERLEQLCERFRLFVGEMAGNLEGILAMLWY